MTRPVPAHWETRSNDRPRRTHCHRHAGAHPGVVVAAARQRSGRRRRLDHHRRGHVHRRSNEHEDALRQTAVHSDRLCAGRGPLGLIIFGLIAATQAPFVALAVALLMHDPEVMIGQFVKLARLPRADAERVEALWGGAAARPCRAEPAREG